MYLFKVLNIIFGFKNIKTQYKLKRKKRIHEKQRIFTILGGYVS